MEFFILEYEIRSRAITIYYARVNIKVILNFVYYTSYRCDAAGLDTVAAATMRVHVNTV